MLNVVVIAGPNGAGKSTLAPALLRDTFDILEYVNADTIAEGLSAFAPEEAAFEAGRVMLSRLHDLAAEKRDFAFETTLATRFYAKWLKELKETFDYRISIIFLWLPDADLAIARVASRVKLGGHNIPETTIRRRYDRGLSNFFDMYMQIADSWRVFDAGRTPPFEVARYTNNDKVIVNNYDLWNKIKR